MWRNPVEIPGNGIDDDGDGYVDDVYGIDIVNHDSDPMDDHGHGTHTAGTIGAVGNNGIGVVGVELERQDSGVQVPRPQRQRQRRRRHRVLQLHRHAEESRRQHPRSAATAGAARAVRIPDR